MPTLKNVYHCIMFKEKGFCLVAFLHVLRFIILKKRFINKLYKENVLFDMTIFKKKIMYQLFQ